MNKSSLFLNHLLSQCGLGGNLKLLLILSSALLVGAKVNMKSSDGKADKEITNGSDANGGSDKPVPAKSSRIATLKRLMRLATPDLLRIVCGLTALVVNSITNLSFPMIMTMALDGSDSSCDNSGDVPFYLSPFALKSAAVFICGSVSSWIRVFCLGTATDRIAGRLRRLLFDSYMDTDMESYDFEKNGERLTLLEKDVDAASECLTDKFAAGLRSLNSSINGSIRLYFTSPRLCAVALSTVPLVGIGAMFLSKISRKLATKLRDLQSDVASYALERFTSFSTVKLNGRETYEKNVFSSKVGDCNTIAESRHFAQGFFMGFINIATNCSLVMVLKVGGDMIAAKQLTTGQLTGFAVQSAFVGLGFAGLASFSSDMGKSLDAARRVFDEIDKNTETVQRNAENNHQSAASSITTSSSDSSSSCSDGESSKKSVLIRMVDVSFAYAARPDKPVLTNFVVDIQPLAITCFVGASGSGKSTVASLLSGLLRPTSGTVEISGSSSGSHSNVSSSGSIGSGNGICAQLSRSIGMVEQSGSTLLSGTIRYNIAYGKSDSAASDADIEKAAQAAYAHDFIIAFPLGYDTEVGVGGSLLSGGQRARIAIARALIKDPPCLILDEATAALDAVSEKEVIDVLLKLRKTKTVILFTHSESMEGISDIVYRIDGGEIVSATSPTLADRVSYL
jgi:ABC-type multidrug transport system fused ATPase/permease subunit